MGDPKQTPLYRLTRWWFYNEDRVMQAICLFGLILFIAWSVFPQLIPVRFGRWLFVSLGLMGCASYDYDWNQSNPPAPKPWAYIYALDTDLACRGLGAQAAAGVRINGCAIWKPSSCIIVLPENPPHWIVEHEERHCNGWSH